MEKERFNEYKLKSAEPPFENYVGSYVVISNVNGRSKMGKLIGFSNGYALLNPFLASSSVLKPKIFKRYCF